MTAPVVASSSSASSVGPTATSVTPPANIANGDLLVCFAAGDWGSYAAMTLPAGFTLLTTSSKDMGTDAGHLKIGWKIASNESGNYSFGAGSSSDQVAGVLRVTGADGTPIIAEVAANTAASGASIIDSPSVTPNGANDLLLVAAVADGMAGTTDNWTKPTGCDAEVFDTQSGTTFTRLAVASKASPSSPSGTQTWTPSGTFEQNNNIACTISIKAAAGQQSTYSVTANVRVGV